jgi:hypothetical protein
VTYRVVLVPVAYRHTTPTTHLVSADAIGPPWTSACGSGVSEQELAERVAPGVSGF